VSNIVPHHVECELEDLSIMAIWSTWNLCWESGYNPNHGNFTVLC
jgi:hypothetical protein